MAGATTPPNTDSISLLPMLQGLPGQKQHDFLYWEFYEQSGARAVRMGKWKGVRKTWNASVELYDLEADLGEQTNIAEKHPDIVTRIEAIMKEARTPSPQWPEPKSEP